MVANFVDRTIVLSARETRSGCDVWRHCTAFGAFAFNISSMVVDMKLWVAPESTIAVEPLAPIVTYNSKSCDES